MKIFWRGIACQLLDSSRPIGDVQCLRFRSQEAHEDCTKSLRSAGDYIRVIAA